MAAKPMTLELVPMDPPSADDDGGGDAKPAAPASTPPASPPPAASPTAAAPAAAVPVIEFVKPGASPIDLDATQPIHADRYLREATLQYQEGHVDAPLWERALAQANGDKEAASAIYVKSRAIALRMLERERRARQPAAGPAPAPPPDFPSEVPDTGDADVARHPPAVALIVRYRIPLIVAGVLVPLLAVVWLVVDHLLARPAAPAAPVAAVAAVAPAKAAAAKAPAAAAAKAVPAEVSAAAAPARAGPSPDLMRKIDELREAKNWNLLVLYLVEWTRQDPRNVDAWNQLRAGYVTLRQYDDALAAAKKAAELAPDDAGMRARVGDVQVYRDDPAAALTTFEETVARDTTDVDSRIRVGLLHAQLGRAPEARAALDGALAIAPGDPLAQCVRLGVAQMTTSPGDTYGRAREARAVDAKCRGQ